MMAATKGGKFIPTVITLPTAPVWHPVLLEVTVFVCLRSLGKTKIKSIVNSQAHVCQFQSCQSF